MHAPGAPVDMVMDPTAQLLFTVLHFAIAIAVTAWICARLERPTRTVALLVLLGGGLTVFAEPWFDRLEFIWHAEVGQWTLFEMYGHSVPLWMLPVYYWYMGGQTLLVLHLLRTGASVRKIFMLGTLFSLADGLLELPILYAGGVYTYFGHQPFWDADWFPLPGWILIINGALPVAAAAGVLLLGSLRDRRYLWAIPAVIPMSGFAVYAAFAWPAWAALNAPEASTVVTHLAATVTVLLGLLVLQVLAHSSVRAVRSGAADGLWAERKPGGATASSRLISNRRMIARDLP